jgi:hypothetical protein
MGEWMYRSTFFLTLALVGEEWSTSRPGRFIPRGKSPRYQLDRRWDGPQSRSGRREEKILNPTDPSIVQPVASRYTDYAIPASKFTCHKM